MGIQSAVLTWRVTGKKTTKFNYLQHILGVSTSTTAPNFAETNTNKSSATTVEQQSARLLVHGVHMYVEIFLAIPNGESSTVEY